MSKYVTGFYFVKEPLAEQGYDPSSPANQLLKYIYENKENFKVQIDKAKDSFIVTLEDTELLKAKEHFNNNQEVLSFIDKCQEDWSTACIYCGTITLNFAPYTYRSYVGTVRKEYNCLHCAGLTNEAVRKVRDAYEKDGHIQAMNTINEMYVL